jgi:hypothetical protein
MTRRACAAAHSRPWPRRFSLRPPFMSRLYPAETRLKEGANAHDSGRNRWECSLAAGWWRPVSALPAVSRDCRFDVNATKRRRASLEGRQSSLSVMTEPPMWRPREQPIASAAGRLSRRLQYPSKNQVDFGCFSKTSVKSASRANCHRKNALAPEVARHQSVHDRAEFAFDLLPWCRERQIPVNG